MVFRSCLIKQNSQVFSRIVWRLGDLNGHNNRTYNTKQNIDCACFLVKLLADTASFLRNDLAHSRLNVLCCGHFQYRDQMLAHEAECVGCLVQFHYGEHLFA